MDVQPPTQSKLVSDSFARGIAAQMRGDLSLAIKEWKNAIAVAPRFPEALYNLGVALALTGKTSEAIETYGRLLLIDPQHKDSLFNLANIHQRQGQNKAANDLYRRLLEKHPTFAPGWINWAKACADSLALKEAEEKIRKAIDLEPENVAAHWNLSHLLLRQRRWKEAWPEYEWRLKRPNWIKPPVNAAPWWEGSPARRILVWNDQGIGDAIQFLRYPRLLAERGLEVWVLVQDTLRMFASTAKGIAQVVGPADPLPEFDAQAPLFSLPLRLGLPEPKAAGTTAYLQSPNNFPLAKNKGKVAIGFVWAGNKRMSNDIHRSVPLSALKPIFDLPHIDAYSLQFGEAREEIAANNLSHHVRDLTPQVHDFADTASIVSALDLVISVDTSVAHVAGALGRPCWLMLSTKADWRFAEDETIRQWYPSIRPFRQQTLDDWNGLVTQIIDALSKENPTLIP